MAKAWITEFSVTQDRGSRTGIPVAMYPAIAEQTVTFTTSSQSAAFNDNTRFVRVIADADCHIAYGANPTADADSLFIPADTSEYFGVDPGKKLAVYDGSS